MECALTLNVHENDVNRVLVPCVNMTFFGGVFKEKRSLKMSISMCRSCASGGLTDTVRT